MDVDKEDTLDFIISHTEIIQMPQHLLATFAITDIEYYFVSSIDTNRTRLRQGVIKAEKPSIINPLMKEHILEGFDEEAQKMLDMLAEKLGSDLRMLGYHFKNNATAMSVLHESPPQAIDQLRLDVKEKPRTALVKGLDHAWQIGLLKLIIEHAGQSFPANIRELEERGFFPGANGIPQKVMWKIEQLFKQAETHPARVKELGSFLKEHNLFREYEDRFFSLVKKIT